MASAGTNTIQRNGASGMAAHAWLVHPSRRTRNRTHQILDLWDASFDRGRVPLGPNRAIPFAIDTHALVPQAVEQARPRKRTENVHRRTRANRQQMPSVQPIYLHQCTDTY